mmetsp:Transcript_851/g.1263  ORF Transcript_851/g.1263 Transcript_851/m.1263 type:complete len:111 (+) Transcript_851:70-402(+)
MAPAAKKMQKKSMESINSKIQLVMRSGKAILGTKVTKRAMLEGKAKMILLSNNAPPLSKSEIEYYALLSKCQVHHYFGNNNDLGTACGKYFKVSAMAIIDPGDSDILEGN